VDGENFRKKLDGSMLKMRVCRAVYRANVTGSLLPRLVRQSAQAELPNMTTKVCANRNCPAYAHFVYTVAMRCVLCRWDLKAAQRSGAAGAVDVSRKSAGARAAT
jgi:hypothetical protein